LQTTDCSRQFFDAAGSTHLFIVHLFGDQNRPKILGNLLGNSCIVGYDGTSASAPGWAGRQAG
jgi:hypothetical protein